MLSPKFSPVVPTIRTTTGGSVFSAVPHQDDLNVSNEAKFGFFRNLRNVVKIGKMYLGK